MAITRFHAPLIPGTKTHMPLDKNGTGIFVLYKDHVDKLKHLRARNEELEAMLYKAVEAQDE